MATIQQILTDLGVPFLESGHHHCRPGWIQLDCPWCGPSSQKFHMGYNIGLGYFNCWRCGGKHPVAALCKLGLRSKEAEEFWKDREFSLAIVPKRVRMGLREPVGIGPLMLPHRRYLRSRGFDPDEIGNIWEVQGIGMAHRLSWRLYIPIIQDGAKVSWTTRAIGERISQRYVSASPEEEAVSAKELIYGLDLCLHSVVVVEGPTDAWRIGPGAGATLGTAVSSSQMRKLIRIPHRFLIFDNSPEAQREAQKLCEQLACFPGTTQNLQIDAEDPGKASPKEVRLIRK